MIATQKAVSSPLSTLFILRAYKGECMENKWCVYCHTSPDGRRYVGITSRKPQKRWNYGRGYKENTYFTRAIEKYGWHSFKHEILCENLTQDGASELEKKFIALFKSCDRNYGFNIDLGGWTRGKVMSEETKRKIGDSHRGRFTDAQWAAAIARRGKGHPQTDEAKKKIGDAHRGRHLPEWQKKHLSEINKGKKMNEAHKEKLRQLSMKAVDQFDMDGNYIATYASLRNAEKETGVLYQNISSCCRGKSAQARGYIWRYSENETGGAV